MWKLLVCDVRSEVCDMWCGGVVVWCEVLCEVCGVVWCEELCEVCGVALGVVWS